MKELHEPFLVDQSQGGIAEWVRPRLLQARPFCLAQSVSDGEQPELWQGRSKHTQ
jgi:hypothetical protein